MEIEAINNRLQRVSQSNIEFKTRCDRLEVTNAELSAENEQNRVKLQSLELELEMTKVNSDRDTEQILEQQRSVIEEKTGL